MRSHPLKVVSRGPHSSITSYPSGGPNIAVDDEMEEIFWPSHEELVGEPIEMSMGERSRNHRAGDHSASKPTARTRPTGTLLELYDGRDAGTKFPFPIGSGSSLKTDERMLLSGAVRDFKDPEGTQQLQSDVEFEKVVSKLARTFPDFAIDCMDSEITNGLREIAEVLELDRVAIILTDLNAKNGTVSHWWGKEGVPPPPAGNIDEHYPWLSRHIINREIVCVSTPKDLPEEAVAERDYFRSVGLRSWLEIPLEVGGEQLGRMSTSTSHRFQTWDSRLVSQFRQAGDVFSGALARKRAAEARGGSEERFRVIANSVPMNLWMSGRDRLCSFANQSWLAFTGAAILNRP